MGIDPNTHNPKSNIFGSANLSHMAQWENARLEAEARLFCEAAFTSCTLTQDTCEDLRKITLRRAGCPILSSCDCCTAAENSSQERVRF
ncbi:hypothetical protein RND71_007282 [Anisodus tanguticus]|uniref:Uncharacterized protein n=1 Tax=Anisodus tanguticus TaxID=243964 RepID=A0AAE1SM32_9SOLA|nr:hypothetical protein RND71_007282 [Anisodus tanguticus]